MGYALLSQTLADIGFQGKWRGLADISLAVCAHSFCHNVWSATLLSEAYLSVQMF
jgi:hypothetical protein